MAGWLEQYAVNQDLVVWLNSTADSKIGDPVANEYIFMFWFNDEMKVEKMYEFVDTETSKKTRASVLKYLAEHKKA